MGYRPACRPLRPPRLPAFALALLLAILPGLPGALLAAPVAAQEAMVFDVLRDGDKIGEHRLDFEREDDTLKVSVQTDMAVTFALVTVFRYEHKRIERWRGGELESLAGMTNDDGKTYEVSIVRKEGFYSRTVNGAEEQIAAPISVDSLWNKDRLTAGKLFSPVSDKTYRVSSNLLGRETIDAMGKPMEAEHYKLTGEIDRDLWYDPSGELLRMRYESDDGETFEYVRR